MELRAPEIAGITLGRIVEVCNLRSVGCRSSGYVADGNVVDGTTEGVEQERTRLLLRGVLADVEVTAVGEQVAPVDALGGDALAVEEELAFVGALVEHHVDAVPLAAGQFLTAIDGYDVPAAIVDCHLQAQVAL